MSEEAGAPFSSGEKGDETHKLAQSIRLPPKSRFRMRSDGGVDDTYCIHFLGPLDPSEMRTIIEAVLDAVDRSAESGIIALTRVDFPQLDTCEFRLWWKDPRSERLNKEFELLYQLSKIHKIQDVDGIRYSFLDTEREP